MPLTLRLTLQTQRLSTLFSQKTLSEAGFLHYRRQDLFLAQQAAVLSLCEAQNDKDFFRRLTSLTRYQNQNLTYAEFLQKNNYSWISWLFTGFLISLSFPISIPLLLLWSKHTRGTFNFLKVSNAIMIDDLLIWYQEGCAFFPSGFESKQDLNSVDSIENINSLVSNMNDKPFSSQKIVARLQNTSQALQVDSAFEVPGVFSDITMPSNIQTVFFTQMEKNTRKKETGMPLIRAFEVLDFKTRGAYSVSIEWVFKWTEHPTASVTLSVLEKLELPDAFRPIHEMRPLDPLFVPQAKRFYQLFSVRAKLDFNETLLKAESTEGITNKKEIYSKAYSLAKCPEDRVRVLEMLVNEYDKHLQYRKSLGSLEKSCEDIILTQIETYLSYLPQNYKEVSKSGLALTAHFDKVSNLIQSHHFDLAWQQYESTPELSYFIRRAFPNLHAMHFQLSAIFIITYHKRMDGRFPIEECEVFTRIKHLFERVFDILKTFGSSQHHALENDVLTPLRCIGKISKEAVEGMSVEERERIYLKAISEGLHRLAHGGEKTYRIPPAQMLRHPQVEELDETDKMMRSSSFS